MSSCSPTPWLFSPILFFFTTASLRCWRDWGITILASLSLYGCWTKNGCGLLDKLGWSNNSCRFCTSILSTNRSLSLSFIIMIVVCYRSHMTKWEKRNLDCFPTWKAMAVKIWVPTIKYSFAWFVADFSDLTVSGTVGYSRILLARWLWLSVTESLNYIFKFTSLDFVSWRLFHGSFDALPAFGLFDDEE